jgi:isopropylmalate/homocitrate/citramalate synthase
VSESHNRWDDVIDRAIADDHDHMTQFTRENAGWLLAQLVSWPNVRVHEDRTMNDRFCRVSAAAYARKLERDCEALRVALRGLISFVRVMHGTGAEAVLPTTVATPLGVSVKIAEMVRDAEEVMGE